MGDAARNHLGSVGLKGKPHAPPGVRLLATDKVGNGVDDFASWDRMRRSEDPAASSALSPERPPAITDARVRPGNVTSGHR